MYQDTTERFTTALILQIFFIFQLMAAVQIPGSERFDAKNIVHTATQNVDVSLENEFQKLLSNA